MRRPRYRVQLCVLSSSASRYGPYPAYNLLGVEYFRSYLPDTEFPRTISQVSLFVRLFLEPPNPTDPFNVVIQVWRLKPDGADREQVNNFTFPVQVDRDAAAHSHAFRLRNVHIPGEGQYAVRVCRRRRRSWKGEVWRVLATDYFVVIRS